MLNLLGDPSASPPNLFTPDFGQEPHLVVGRDDLNKSLRAGLGAGPTDPRFTTLLLGPRGSGKTVILNTMRDIARQAGWIVLTLDATTSGITERIVEHIAWAQDTHESAPAATGPDSEERTAAKFKLLSFEWQREIVHKVRNAISPTPDA